MIDKIRTEKQYKQVMHLIEAYLQKATKGGGFDSLNEKEADELHEISLLAADYEKNVMKLWPLPITINTVLNQKMQELDVTQKSLAEMLGIGTSKLSQILNGKREPDVPFLKAIHKKLGIDGNFILESV